MEILKKITAKRLISPLRKRDLDEANEKIIFAESLRNGINNHQSKNTEFIINQTLSNVVNQLKEVADDGVEIFKLSDVNDGNDVNFIGRFGIYLKKDELRNKIILFDITDSMDAKQCKKIVTDKLSSEIVGENIAEFFTNINQKCKEFGNKTAEGYPLSDFSYYQ